MRPGSYVGQHSSASFGVSKGSPVPLYYQLAERLRELIRAGDLTVGDQLPPDRELAEQAGISRMTARQAIAYLVREGVLEVKPGIGTFVAEPKLAYDALHLLGFTEETMRHGGAVSTRVLEQAIVPASPAIQGALRLLEGERIVRIVRLRSTGDTPVLLETISIPASRCPGLEAIDLERQSLYDVLETRYGIRLNRARQTIEATVANDYERDLFGIETGTPMLMLEGVTSDDDDRPVECFKAIYRADRIRFTLESRRADTALGPGSLPQLAMVLND